MRGEMKALIGLRRVHRVLAGECRWEEARQVAYACGLLEGLNSVRTGRTVESIVGRLHREACELPVYGQAVTA